MLKFCRECECVMAGEAAFCPGCGVPWEQPLPRSLAEAADLLQPPAHCGTCGKQLVPPRFFCPRCGADVDPWCLPADHPWETAVDGPEI